MRSRVFVRVCIVLLGAGVLAAGGDGFATPFVPDSDAMVLERLPERTDPSLAELKRMRRVLAADPDNVAVAVKLARRAIEASRETGDPRFLGQAQAALARWWSNPQAPSEVIVLRATIRQSTHQFPEALADLDRLLAAQPANGQARLTRATILTVIGRYADAERDCAALARVAPEVVTVTCMAGAASADGRADTAYRDLVAALARGDRRNPSVTAWAQTLAAEIAMRQGDARAAEAHFRAALAADPQDAYLRGAYADYLIDVGRPREAAAMVGDDLRNDTLLLRLVLAEARFDAPTAEERRAFAAHRADMAARFEASRARGDTVHRREEARFALHIERDVPRALALARANWDVQREAPDLRILAETARAANDAAALAIVQTWQQEHGLRDGALASAKEAR